MLKKIAIVSLSAVLLGGCSLNLFGMNNAAKDSVESSPVPTVTTTPDATLLQANPSTAPGNDDTSLETDINNTNVVQEDFSNLK